MPKLKPGTIWPKPAKVELTQEHELTKSPPLI